MLALVFLIALYTGVVYVTYEYIFEHSKFNGHRITEFGFRNEVLLLINLGLFWVFISRRLILSIFLTLFLYAIFILICFEKIKFFNSPLLPADFKYVDQLVLIWPIFKSYIPVITVTVIALVITVLLLLKKEAKFSLMSSSKFVVTVPIFLMLFLVSIKGSNLYGALKYKLASNEKGRAHLVSSSEKNGLLVTFVRNVLHTSNEETPENYSKETIKSIVDKHQLNRTQVSVNQKEEKVNLIVYLIESFTDPTQAGIRTTEDPIPFFHKLQQEHPSGFVYSPEIGGRSANAEFELLTGFSIHFFAQSTIPFIDLPYREFPSLTRELAEKNYYTKVIQAANLGFFNYKKMYKTLGFEDVISFSGDKNIPKDIAGRFPSDEAIVDEIINSSQTEQPYFIYAFPNSTHGTWKYKGYEDSSLDLILDKPLNDPLGQRQLRTYVNALNTADKAIEKLVNHFEQQQEKTIILILGDHQPGMPEFREQYMFKEYPGKFTFQTRKKLKSQFLRFDEQNPLESYKIMHKVPYVIWSNFDTSNSTASVIGMNGLIIQLFEKLNVTPHSPFYQFLKKYLNHTDYDSLLKYAFYSAKDMDENALIWNDEYKHLQYDLLLGEEYLTESDR